VLLVAALPRGQEGLPLETFAVCGRFKQSQMRCVECGEWEFLCLIAMFLLIFFL
jgi:hypothetical protein